MSKINLDVLKNRVIKDKIEIAKIDKEAKIIGEKFQQEKKKRDAISDKQSAQYELQAGITDEVLKELREKNEERNKIETKIKSTISSVRDRLETDKEELAKKAIEKQKEIQNLKKDIKYFEDLNDRDKSNNKNIKNDDQIIQNRQKRIKEIKEKIEITQQDISSNIKEIDEINNKLQYIDYDNIENYKSNNIDNKQNNNENRNNENINNNNINNKQNNDKEKAEKLGKQILSDMSRDYKHTYFNVESLEKSDYAINDNKNKPFDESELEELNEENEEISSEQLENLEIIEEDKKNKPFDESELEELNEENEEISPEQLENLEIIEEDNEKRSRFKNILNKIKESKFAELFEKIKAKIKIFTNGIKLLPSAMRDVSRQAKIEFIKDFENDKEEKQQEDSVNEILDNRSFVQKVNNRDGHIERQAKEKITSYNVVEVMNKAIEDKENQSYRS